MVIKNLTPKVQPLKVEELVGGKALTLYVEGNGTTDLDGVYIPNTEKIKGIFEIVGSHAVDPVIVHEEIVTSPTSGDKNPEENKKDDRTPEEDKKPEEPSIVDKFICDECGSEFASARGLASHKNKAHSGE